MVAPNRSDFVSKLSKNLEDTSKQGVLNKEEMQLNKFYFFS